MQPTDTSDLLERVGVLLSNAPLAPAALAEGDGSLLTTPMVALTAYRGFDEVFGVDDMLFKRLAKDADDAVLARLFLELEAGLADGSLRPGGPPDPVRRLSGFVYPVI